MKIYLYLSNKIVSFSLPSEISGSFSFDENNYEDSKLINIEARDGKWVLYSTSDVSIIDNNTQLKNISVEIDKFYILRRNNVNYLIYTNNPINNNIEMYKYNENLNLIIGNDNTCNIQYNFSLIKGVAAQVKYQNNQLIINKNIDNIYINNKTLKETTYIIRPGDILTLYSLKIIFLSNIIIVVYQNGKLNSNMAQLAKLEELKIQPLPKEEIEIKDIELYNKDSYFSKSPRIRREIEQKEIKLSQPPNKENDQELPLILTIGPMMTMGVTSCIMVIDVINKINTHQTTLKESWTSLVTSSVMLISMLLWPIVINIYNKKLKIKKREELITKYSKYLDEKKQELEKEQKIEKEILNENLISVAECINNINNKSVYFWSKRIDQKDFLIVRLGIGKVNLATKIRYPDEGFSVDEDELKKKTESLIKEYKYIDNVPIGYSFYENKLTAIMGNNRKKSVAFTNNIIIQLLSSYSYDDLKIVIFTNENNASEWQYIKYLNHNFSNDKTIRLYSSTLDTSKQLADYLNTELNMIKNEKDNHNNNNNYNYRPYYMIIVDDYDRVKNYELFQSLTETEENIGFSILIIEERLSKLPSKCDNFISLGENESGILKNSFDKQEQATFKNEIVYDVNMMDIARKISNIPIEFKEKESEIPDSINFLEMERVGKVEQLNTLNRWKTNDSTTSLKAEIGINNQKELIYLDLHEKYHGPHGLIAGTTGSGKSEFIITYILSMCINYSPDDVSFILIDYKGGGLALAFENRTTGVVLPHLAGTITNLDKAEMDRTLVSIDSEVKRRQRIFNEARDKLGESTIDIYKYQRHFHEGKLDDPIPHLFIICDEFAELKSQQPEFMDNLISVARIGRSLGVHLILATQKPSGVVNDQIWSNSKFKVCLKVQDEQDSKEMLKKPDAAYLKQAGRFYLQVGYDEYYILGQSGWCGAKYYPSDKIVKSIDKSINIINDNGQIIKSQSDSNKIKIEPQGEQLSAIMKNIISISNTVGKKARRLWLDNIPPIILINDIEKKYNVSSIKYNVEAIIGEYDAPEKQEQGIVKYNYLINGNTLIYGNDSSETDMFLSTLIYSTAKNHSVEEINFYLIDYGSETLRMYSELPQIGGMVFQEETEKYNNLIKLLKEEINNRKKIFRSYGGEYINYIKNSNQKLPIITVIINNFSSFYEAVPEAYDQIPEIIRDSERYGIIYIFTGNATNSIPNKISQNIRNIYAYKLKDNTEYQYLFNSKTKTVPRNTEGRGLLKYDDVHEFQTASITENKDDLNKIIIDFINNQKNTNKTKAKSIPHLPKIVRINDIKSKLGDIKNIPIGIEKNTLDICTLNLIDNNSLLISSNKLDDTKNFVISLLYILKYVKDLNIYIIDSENILTLDNKYFPNHYNNELDKIIEQLNEKIKKLIKEKSNEQGIIFIHNVEKLISKLEDTSKLEELTSNLTKYTNYKFIITGEAKRIKDMQYDQWYNILKDGNGLWIGKGLADQTVLKTSSFSKETQISYPNSMGFKVIDGEETLLKYIDIITSDQGDKNE